jgi:hypothetical protein
MLRFDVLYTAALFFGGPVSSTGFRWTYRKKKKNLSRISNQTTETKSKNTHLLSTFPILPMLVSHHSNTAFLSCYTLLFLERLTDRPSSNLGVFVVSATYKYPLVDDFRLVDHQ